MIGKSDMIHNSATLATGVSPETCDPAKILSMTQRYFLF